MTSDKSSPAVHIEGYQPAWREHFYRLNAAWLERDFSIEPIDVRVFSDPQREIIDHGGAVLFALVEDEVVGTCALKHHGAQSYELTEMAVDEARRDRASGASCWKPRSRSSPSSAGAACGSSPAPSCPRHCACTSNSASNGSLEGALDPNTCARMCT